MIWLSVLEKNGESETPSPRLRSLGRVLENFQFFANPFVSGTFTAQKSQSDNCLKFIWQRLCNKTKAPTTFSTFFALLTDKNPLCYPSLFTRLIPVR